MTAPELQPSDFGAFFRAVYSGRSPGESPHAPDPFPWQQRLLAQVAEQGAWPSLLDLPTGSGKTAAIDIAVFLLALPNIASQPRRIVFVVDRRIVVHQAAEHARQLSHALATSTDPAVRAIANRLLKLAPSPIGDQGAPLHHAELRGGIVRDETWATRPDTPTVIVSTVDQVGSRLLFRGYGVSRGMRPIHAGLLGSDALFLLDEVHLAQPFANTLRSIDQRYQPPSMLGLPRRWQVVELSATPTETERPRSAFALDDADLDARISPVLARRIAASKPARTRAVKAPGKNSAKHRSALAAACIEEAARLLEDGARTIGVVVNRVASATDIHTQLQGSRRARSVLLTGRMRPFDRDDILADIGARIATGWRDHIEPTESLVVVATQAIEAGADLDLDALVTECAALDALRQRFGRIDRDGVLSARHDIYQSAVLATTVDTAEGADPDPVYGTALRDTWRWLESLGDDRLDFGNATLAQLIDGTDTQPLASPVRPVPELHPSHLDRWVQTSRPPVADPDPMHWLHGIGTSSRDVTVVWRGDIGAGLEDEAVRNAVVDLIAICPPSSGEAMSVPLRAVQQWLARNQHPDRDDGAPFDPVADVVIGADVSDNERLDPGAPILPALRWRGDDSEWATVARDVRPGDTLIVPASYGGVRDGSWDPTAAHRVPDLATRSQATQRRRGVLRLMPFALPEGIPDVPIPNASDDIDEETDALAIEAWLLRAQAWVDETDGDGAQLGVCRRVLVTLRDDRDRRIDRFAVPWTARDGAVHDMMYVVSSRAPVGPHESVADDTADSVDSEPTTSSFIGTEVSLQQHLSDVEKWARTLAENCGLGSAMVEDVALAGHLHDLGKADPRFQQLLRGGELAPADSPLLAKSATSSTDRRARNRAWRASRYPRGARHELLSVALIETHDRLRARAHDWELVLHLVASHHGWARPFVPVSIDRAPLSAAVRCGDDRLETTTDHGLARLDSGIPERFWRLVRRYGWYGLAWLEAILRLADHRASAAEQENKFASEVEVTA
ncbi:MAG: type I-G CRISPR-associated helicase/endonuclease Cas3g [Acidimicrobiia bacterium]